MTKNTVICLMGLTGTGKTALAMSLYDKLPLEIINVDSALIYQGMDIGTAKPELALLEKYPHHLVNIISPWQSYSAAAFVKDVNILIDEIQSRGKQPLLVGGTMMYFKALQQGLNDVPDSQPAIRDKLNKEREQCGLESLYKRLQECDPITATRLEANDSQRVMRALEIFEISGLAMSEFLAKKVNSVKHDFFNIALVPDDRKKLHGLIEKRFEIMLDQGFVNEVKKLKDEGLTLEQTSMRCVGYKQMLEYLDGDCSYEEMQQKAIAATRQLAKRQHTWLRKWPELHSFDPWEPNLLEDVLKLVSR